LETQIGLLNTRISGGTNKAPEIKWRKALVKSLATEDERGNLVYQKLGPDTLAKIQEGIRLGEESGKSARQKNVERAQQWAKQKGLADPSEMRQGTGRGYTVKDWMSMKLEFDALIEHMTQRLATSRVVAKQAVTHVLVDGKKKHNELKPFVDAIADAANKKDRTALAKAVQELNAKAQELSKKTKEVNSYVWNVRYSKLFQALRNDYNNISDWMKKPELDATQMDTVQNVIKRSEKLINLYENFSKQIIGRSERGAVVPGKRPGLFYYEKTLEVLKQLVAHLKNKIGPVPNE
jgi:hypothetical protein